MTTISVAGHVVADPTTVVRQYAQDHGGTIQRYDLAGPGEPDRLAEDEIVRTRIFRSRISGSQLKWFLERAESAPWPDVPQSAKLVDARPGTSEFETAAALYEHFRADAPSGVAVAKVSKVLHVKRPGLIPVVDSRLRRLYANAARDAAKGTGYKFFYWEAIRRDLETNQSGLEQLRGSLQSDGALADLTALSDVRLLDILAWKV